MLDESTVGVDPALREELWRLFRSLRQRGVSLLVSSHVMDEASRCDQLLLIHNGHILTRRAPEELTTLTGHHDLERAFLSLIQASHTGGGRHAKPPQPHPLGHPINPALAWPTTVRVLHQLRHDPRTIALLLLAPALLLFLLGYVFNNERFFSQLTPQLVAIPPWLSSVNSEMAH